MGIWGLVANLARGRSYGLDDATFVNFLQSEEARKQIIFTVSRYSQWLERKLAAGRTP